MLHGFRHQSLPLKPAAGAVMQRRHFLRRGAISKAVPQSLDEQGVIAIPTLLVVQWHDEQVTALELCKEQLTVGRLYVRGFGRWSIRVSQGFNAENRIAERPAHPIENRSMQQERLNMAGLPRKDFFGQIFEDEAVAAGERADKAGTIGATPHR